MIKWQLPTHIFACQKVMNESEIWPVFQKLFNKKSKNV